MNPDQQPQNQNNMQGGAMPQQPVNPAPVAGQPMMQQPNQAMPQAMPQQPQMAQQPQMMQQPQMYGSAQPSGMDGGKSFKTAWLLSLLLGFWGIDRFYMGKVVTGILKFLTGGGWGIWWLIDVILILTGKTKTKKGEPLANRPASMAIPTVVSVIVLLIVIPAYIGLMLVVELTFLQGVQKNAQNNGTSYVVQQHGQYVDL